MRHLNPSERDVSRPLAVPAALAAICALLLAGAFTASVRAEPTSSDGPKLVGVVNINTATAEELELLPGVGPARAKAIVEHREAHGVFKAPGDLQQISGIGERGLARMKPFIATSGKTTARVER